MKRKCVGIWQCRKCDKVLAGGAYNPRYKYLFCNYFISTAIAQSVRSTVRRLRDAQ